MRKTYTQLQQTGKDYCVDDRTTTDSSLSAADDFIKTEINNTITEIARFFKVFRTRPLPKTLTTVADRQFYQYPSGLNSIQTATLEIGSITYPFNVVNSQEEWDRINAITYVSETIPKFIFPRKYDFGVYPIPQDTYTLTIVGNYSPINLTYEDFSTGTVALTNDSATVTGTDTAWATDVAGKWFVLTDSNYKITSKP